MEESIVPKIKTISEKGNLGQYEIEPLAPGFGYTVGNSIRRVLLSSLRGSAITEVKINGATHEFATLDNVKDDVLAIILNLKDIKVKNLTEEPVVLKLKTNKVGKVTAADFSANANIEILNPEHLITTLDKGAELVIEAKIENGFGFKATEEREKSKDYGVVSVDAVFTPVEAVNYRVENTRVGQMTDYDKLILEITTNGVCTPMEALQESVKILLNQFKMILEQAGESNRVKIEEPKIEEEEVEEDSMVVTEQLDSKTKVSDLGLSSRTVNALVNAGIKTYGGLKRLSDLKISEVKGLGNKGFEEIKKLLER